jgi:hypothetical protein
MVTSGRALLRYETACQALAEVRTKTLAAIKAMFNERATDKTMTEEVAGRMFSQDIVDALVAIEDGPWKFYSGKDRDKPITQNGLARLLKPITPQNLRVGALQAKGYERHQFEEYFESFKPSQRPKCDEIRISDNFNPSSPNGPAFKRPYPSAPADPAVSGPAFKRPPG